MRAALTPSAFRAAWDHLDLGAMPIVLHVPESTVDSDEPDPRLANALHQLALPTLALDLRLGIGSTSTRAMVVAGGIRAVLTRDEVVVEEVGDMTTALVELVPEKGVRAWFGAFAMTADGRKHRVDVVVDEDITRPALKGRIDALLDTIRSKVFEKTSRG
ncbi:ESX secretion-associated protein EspG [Nocardia sp. NRRL S-836]|uniref:ESX secretion-associated protein EspG n=1 Tax=Nocardia sp. NRRL S-836 TaxID=1519492 RepID=UPI0006B0319F|nr:ESX secretion-associated protein EspG [Nocardia sp. NRRL S-836]